MESIRITNVNAINRPKTYNKPLKDLSLMIGDELYDFEKKIKLKIKDMVQDNKTGTVNTSCGYLHPITYNYIKHAKLNFRTLAPHTCASCNKKIIMTISAISSQELENCPLCSKSMHNKKRNK